MATTATATAATTAAAVVALWLHIDLLSYYIDIILYMRIYVYVCLFDANVTD